LKDGYAKWTAKYDERGNQVEAAFFGVDGAPVSRAGGYFKRVDKYDDRGNRIERAWFGTQAEPVEVEGAHRLVRTYDPVGKVVSENRYDPQGNVKPNPPARN
jgi:hypothetical protein